MEVGFIERAFSLMASSTIVSSKDRSMALQQILAEFDLIFQEPKALHPVRACDHHITPLSDILLVVVKSYRYPHFLKDKIKTKIV